MTSVKRGINLNDFGKSHHKRLRGVSDEELDKFAFGAIIKVKVRNFVTYALTEFTLSPSLNMIIGPNGAGKSTFVCAVCLGLGGHPTLLGRQKTLSGFVKNGEQSSTIEITLKNQPGKPNVVITREIYQNNKSDWQINQRPSSESKVKQFLQSFNIQLDNLCQFLPQEKVADFAKCSPEELLLETQRAIDVKLLEQHKELISLDTDKETLRVDLVSKQEKAEKLEHDQTHYEEEAKKYEAFKKKREELDDHEKLLPYAQMQDLKVENDRLKAKRDELKKELQEFLEQSAPFDNAIAEYDENLEKCINSLHDKKKAAEDIQKKIQGYDQRLQKIEKKQQTSLGLIEEHKASAQKIAKNLENLRSELENCKDQKSQVEIPDPNVLQNLRLKMNDLHDQKTDLQTQVQQKVDELQNVSQNIQRHSSRMVQYQEQFKSTDRIHVLTSDRNRTNPQAKSAREAVKLLRTDLRDMRKNVYEPPCLTVSATRVEYAAFLEELLDYQTALALTATSNAAYTEASNVLLDKYNINVPFRYLNNRQLTGDVPDEQLRRMGFDGYLRDFLTGPPPVIQMLSEQSFIHDIPVAVRPLSESQIEDLRRPRDGRLIFRKFFSGDTLYNLSISRYGSRQITVKTTNVKKNLTLFGSGGLSEERKQELKRSIRECQDEIEDLKGSIPPIEEEKHRIGARLEEVEIEYKEIESDFREANNAKKIIEKLEQRIINFTEKIRELETEQNKDHSAELIKYQRRIKALFVEKITDLTKLAKAQILFNEIQKEVTLLEIRYFEEDNKKKSIQKLTRSFEEEKRELEERYNDAKKRLQQFRNSDTRRQLQEQTASYSPELKEKLTEYIIRYTEEGKFNENGVLGLIEGISSELKLLGTSSKSSINALEKIVAELEDLRKQIGELTDIIELKEKSLLGIQRDWEPRLYQLVGRISQKFSSIFPTVGIAGEVKIAKAERFSDWKLEILVQFREAGVLKVLDSHTQSGGERAVSTVYYMISLQELTTSPFRVVDEINQGMDARNEKTVHEHMVDTACQENTSQYFLITPKLLTNLHYAKNMRVHCIMAGPWTPNTRENAQYLSLGTTSLYAN